jgi:CheY-like chemotaxis protein
VTSAIGSILLVEDDPGAIEAFTHMLTAEGYSVRVTTDGPSALAEIERAVPAAIVLDLQLPVIDGLDVLRRLRTMAALAQTPVAIVTGNYMLDERIAGELQALGARVYFKPIWADDLVRIVRALLNG